MFDKQSMGGVTADVTKVEMFEKNQINMWKGMRYIGVDSSAILQNYLIVKADFFDRFWTVSESGAEL